MSAPPLTPNAWLRYDVVSRLLPPGGGSLLEIGCGQGGFAARLATTYDYLGVEPDGTSYATAKARLRAVGRGEVRHGMSFDVVEPDRRFDLVCAFEVLEHIDDQEAAVRSWMDSINPGGHLLISVPAFQERFAKADVFAGHFRRYSPEQMTDLLRRCGLEEITTVVYGVPLGYVLEHGRNFLLGRRLESAQTVAPGAASDHFSPTVTAAPEVMEERTAGSGRVLQPKDWMGPATQVLTAPFRRIQRRFPTRGTGLVARARVPGPRSTQ